MAAPQTPRERALAALGTISAAANAGETAAQAIQRVRDEAERLGVTLGFQDYQEAARIFGETVASREAAGRFSTAAAESPILGNMTAPEPYGSVGAFGKPREFDVRVYYQAVHVGQAEEGYVTLRYTGGLPATVGELRAAAADVTQHLVEGYGRSLTGIGRIQIGEV